MQARMTERNKAGIIISKHIHGARAKPANETQETFLLFDLRRPAVKIAAEGNARRMGKVIPSERFAFDDLDKDADAFIVIGEFLRVSINERIRIHHAGIDARNGFGQLLETFVMAPLIRKEDTFILPRKRSAEVIFEKAGRTHDQRSAARFIHDPA